MNIFCDSPLAFLYLDVCQGGEGDFFFSFFLLIDFYWSIVALQCCVSFFLYSKMNQLSIYIYPLLFLVPSHSGQRSATSRVK